MEQRAPHNSNTKSKPNAPNETANLKLQYNLQWVDKSKYLYFFASTQMSAVGYPGSPQPQLSATLRDGITSQRPALISKYFRVGITFCVLLPPPPDAKILHCSPVLCFKYLIRSDGVCNWKCSVGCCASLARAGIIAAVVSICHLQCALFYF